MEPQDNTQVWKCLTSCSGSTAQQNRARPFVSPLPVPSSARAGTDTQTGSQRSLALTQWHYVMYSGIISNRTVPTACPIRSLTTKGKTNSTLLPAIPTTALWRDDQSRKPLPKFPHPQLIEMPRSGRALSMTRILMLMNHISSHRNRLFCHTLRLVWAGRCPVPVFGV